MKPLYCWRCEAVVPMFEEGEGEALRALYRQTCTALIPHEDRPHTRAELLAHFDGFFAAYERAAGVRPPSWDAHYVYDHDVSRYGPPCHACGLPLRTPAARFCAGCKTPRHGA